MKNIKLGFFYVNLYKKTINRLFMCNPLYSGDVGEVRKPTNYDPLI